MVAAMATPGAPGPTPTGSDWPTQLTDTIVGVVGKVRDRTTVPLETAARAVVYGTIAATVGLVAMVMITVVGVRLLEVYLPVGGVWLPYLIVGGLFTVVGAFLLFVKTKPKTTKD